MRGRRWKRRQSRKRGGVSSRSTRLRSKLRSRRSAGRGTRSTGVPRARVRWRPASVSPVSPRRCRPRRSGLRQGPFAPRARRLAANCQDYTTVGPAHFLRSSTRTRWYTPRSSRSNVKRCSRNPLALDQTRLKSRHFPIPSSRGRRCVSGRPQRRRGSTPRLSRRSPRRDQSVRPSRRGRALRDIHGNVRANPKARCNG